MSERLPAIFFGHGNPMNALADNAWTRGWANIGQSLPRPKAILCVSAHWYVPALAVTAMKRPRTIHDFGGFPRELFEFQYPAPGAPKLAARVIELLGNEPAADEAHWGLDHGTWSVLCHAFPEADIPVVQLSIDETREAAWHYKLASKLRPLRDEGVLVIGSGDIAHNLHTYAWGRDNVEAFDWAMRFETAARELMLQGEHRPLIEYETMGKDALLSVPTPEHYLPLLYVLAQQMDDDAVSFPVDGFDGGSVSMLSVRIG
ncbi:MAG: 4,5-DOPA dioxygenase extradiol [Pyrinomonadaceae bacterium]